MACCSRNHCKYLHCGRCFRVAHTRPGGNGWHGSHHRHLDRGDSNVGRIPTRRWLSIETLCPLVGVAHCGDCGRGRLPPLPTETNLVRHGKPFAGVHFTFRNAAVSALRHLLISFFLQPLWYIEQTPSTIPIVAYHPGVLPNHGFVEGIHIRTYFL